MMFRLFVLLVLLSQLSSAVVYFRVLDAQTDAINGAPSVSIFLNGTQMNDFPVLYGHSTGFSTTEPLIYYTTTAGVWLLELRKYSNSSILYDETVVNFEDGKYYTTILGADVPLTVEDSDYNGIASGFAKGRLVNSWTSTGNATFILKLINNGVTVYSDTFNDDDVVGYVDVNTSLTYNITVAPANNQAVTYLSFRDVRLLSQLAYTIWLFGPFSSGNSYNGTMLDGPLALAETVTPTSTPAGTSPSPGTPVPGTPAPKTPAGTNPKPNPVPTTTIRGGPTSSGSGFLLSALVLVATLLVTMAI